MEQINFNESLSLPLLLNWTILPRQVVGQPERKPVRQFHTLTNPDQRASPPNPDITEVEDFKYFLTASVRPRTWSFS